MRGPFRIAVDTGGTFTDVVVAAGEGETLRCEKAPTSPERAYEAIAEALAELGRADGLGPAEILADTQLFLYGTTRATNAILTGATGATAFLTTAGFPDILTLREGGKLGPFDFTQAPREPFVPRELTFEIPGRIDSEGNELRPLDEEAVLAACAAMRERGVEAAAVCLLWAIANPAHELAVRELLARELPDLKVTLSHLFNPIVREYRRASSATLNAALMPLMEAHLAEIESDLRAAGFGGELLVVTSTGGCVSIAEAAEKPLYCASSGPSLAPVAGRAVAAELGIEEDLVVCDTGGTSFDVSVVRAGEVASTRETWLGGVFTGHMTGLSSVEVTSIGAGGGSIAWVDDGGLLHVGPQSAGSVPGPACYGRGGTSATVTDAAAVLGYLNPDRFLGGRMRLDLDAAAAAIAAAVGEPLGLELDEAALAVVTIAGEAMALAIRDATINQGVDPRECAVMLGGGAGPMVGPLLVPALGARRVVIPATASTLSASGAQVTDIRKDQLAHAPTVSDEFDFDRVGAAAAALEERCRAFLAEVPREFVRAERVEWAVEARYPNQAWELELPLPAAPADAAAVAELEQGFHRLHETRFAVSEPGQRVECQSWKATAVAELAHASLASPPAAAEPAAGARREMYFAGPGRAPVPIATLAELEVGATVAGPLVIELPGTTIVVPPLMSAVRTAGGHVVLEPEGGEGEG